jgi:hypothetical protein
MSNDTPKDNNPQDNNPQPKPEQPVIPQFPSDRIEKGEKTGDIETKGI